MEYHNIGLSRDVLIDYMKRWGNNDIGVRALWNYVVRDGYHDQDQFLDILKEMEGNEVFVLKRDDEGKPLEIRRNQGYQDQPYQRSEPYQSRGQDQYPLPRSSYGSSSEKMPSGDSSPVRCPKCNGGTYISDEEVVKILENTDPIKVILRITYICRSCGERFTRVVAQDVDARKRKEYSQPTPGLPTSPEAVRPGMSSSSPYGTGEEPPKAYEGLKFLDTL